MVRDRRVVLAFVALQVLVPLVLLGLRFVQQGAWPTTNYRYGWQVYSAVDDDVMCRLRDRCEP